jgi:hypothetical protein
LKKPFCTVSVHLEKTVWQINFSITPLISGGWGFWWLGFLMARAFKNHVSHGADSPFIDRARHDYSDKKGLSAKC